LYNSISIVKYLKTGSIFNIKNLANNLYYNNKDIYKDNLGKEINFYSYLNSSNN
ncbi:uncharacterized protein BKA55DRAFT_531044, partial [Fusarium redolens]